jgi:CubicO group peptidase (beta-lactamase class C family)
VRDASGSQPVTPNTLFMIGSMTKPLTSLMMARLVDRGAFTWETPVTALKPSFALGDPEATKRVTMAHTVCACTGLPRWDMEFIFEWNGSTPDKRMGLLEAMKPTTGFGETFQYSNLMVATGGYVAALTGTKTADPARAYIEAMTNEVLRPLGMNSTALSLDAAVRREHARPHGRTLTFEPQPIATETERGVDSVMPAGGAWSNVRDISRWLLLELGKGRLDGTQIISESNLLERRKPRVKINAQQSYGLALFVDESRGLEAIGHGGNTFGFSADAMFFPDHDLGLVVLTNVAAGNAYTGALRRRLIEILLGASEEAERGLSFGEAQRAEAIKKQMQEIALTPDPAFVKPLMGTWTNDRLGKIDIREARGAACGDRGPVCTLLDAGEWSGPLGMHTDKAGTRRLLMTGPPFAGIAFWPQEQDGKPVLLFETAQQKYVFVR